MVTQPTEKMTFLFMHASLKSNPNKPGHSQRIAIMPLPPKPDVSKAATPTYGPSFDPWNSSSTGHQRAENRLGGSTGWRDSRSAKLQLQFKGGADGGKRMFDAVGAGSQDWDPKLQAVVPQELRARVRNSVLDMLSKPGMMKQSMASPSRCSTSTPADKEHKSSTMEDKLTNKRQVEDEAREKEENRSRKVLDGVVVYINGSTHPIISDHKLKHVLVEHGARLSIHLGRRQVTHVILGRPAGGRSGSGGGLAGGKLRKEIQRIGGAPVKFVGVEW